MALQFVLGSAGSGKSGYVFRKTVKEAQKNLKKNYYVVVPEQFTMQTQRELVRLQEKNSIMNIDVVSFQRLAYRIFDELGKTNMAVLEEKPARHPVKALIPLPYHRRLLKLLQQ